MERELFALRMEEYRTMVEDFLDAQCVAADEPYARLLDAMRYSLPAGGKRLRPILTLEFCRLCGDEPGRAMPFAAAVEMIHSYSLIHDDLPCMDDSPLRRGKPSVHAAFGEDMALLAGDGLLNLAFETMLDPANRAGIPAERALSAAFALAKAAGVYGMVGGQVLDLAAEEKAEADAQDVYAIQARKTGALIAAACQLGVAAADGSAAQMAAAAAYADHVGLAFQIRDDILDVIGSQEAG